MMKDKKNHQEDEIAEQERRYKGFLDATASGQSNSQNSGERGDVETYAPYTTGHDRGLTMTMEQALRDR
jgi:hypothetical protein